MLEEHLLGVDVGTTSIKLGLFTTNGKLEAMSTQEYSLLTPSSSMVELPARVNSGFIPFQSGRNTYLCG